MSVWKTAISKITLTGKNDPMRIPLNSSHQQSTYVITTDDAAELVRLVHQDYLLILGMQGFFPRQIDLHKVGYWTLHVVPVVGC